MGKKSSVIILSSLPVSTVLSPSPSSLGWSRRNWSKFVSKNDKNGDFFFFFFFSFPVPPLVSTEFSSDLWFWSPHLWLNRALPSVATVPTAPRRERSWEERVREGEDREAKPFEYRWGLNCALSLLLRSFHRSLAASRWAGSRHSPPKKENFGCFFPSCY